MSRITVVCFNIRTCSYIINRILNIERPSDLGFHRVNLGFIDIYICMPSIVNAAHKETFRFVAEYPKPSA